jgi:hypothetical protein
VAEARAVTLKAAEDRGVAIKAPRGNRAQWHTNFQLDEVRPPDWSSTAHFPTAHFPLTPPPIPAPIPRPPPPYPRTDRPKLPTPLHAVRAQHSRAARAAAASG